MIALLDNGQDLEQCSKEMGVPVGQLLTPLTSYTLRAEKFAIDNGGFNELDVNGLVRIMKREEANKERCYFVTAPDVACSALRTIELFHHFKGLFKGWPVAFVCQDGQEHLPMPWEEIDAIFIGGSTNWKCSQHAVHLVKAAKAMGKWVHAGRVNTALRWTHFEKIGTNSADGTGIGRYTHMRHAISDRKIQGEIFDA